MTSTPPVTQQLCEWTSSLSLDQIPSEIVDRVKHLLLDAVACGIVGSHVPWSQKAFEAITSLEGPGSCALIGWKQKLNPQAAALLNGAFIQATELDDFHNAAPIHGGSIVLSALLAAADYVNASGKKVIGGEDLLLAAIVGLEAGPRIGLAMHGFDVLNRGWHSGVVFGSPAAALAVSKLLALDTSQTASALSIGATQAGGLMAAQYDGMVKRMQHGFAARNGLLGALLAQSGYEGFSKALERDGSGFLHVFSQGTKLQPQYRPEIVVKDLGTKWHLSDIHVKMHPACGAIHGVIENVALMQVQHQSALGPDADLSHVESIKVEASRPMLTKSGWKPESRPVGVTTAQMSIAYAVAAQLVDGQVLLDQFSEGKLNRDAIWDLIEKTETAELPSLADGKAQWTSRVTVTFKDGNTLQNTSAGPKGMGEPITNEEILKKFLRLMKSMFGDVTDVVCLKWQLLDLEHMKDVSVLTRTLATEAVNALA